MSWKRLQQSSPYRRKEPNNELQCRHPSLRSLENQEPMRNSASTDSKPTPSRVLTKVHFPISALRGLLTKIPTKCPTRVSMEVPTKLSTKAVSFHMSCFHMFCSLPNMTGRPGYRTMEMMEEVPRRTSLVPLAFPRFLYCLIGVETEGLLDFQGRAGDHFHCTVEPSPGHIRCRIHNTPCTEFH